VVLLDSMGCRQGVLSIALMLGTDLRCLQEVELMVQLPVNRTVAGLFFGFLFKLDLYY